MKLKSDVWNLILETVRKYPNDMELGEYVRQKTLSYERRQQRNKNTHLKDKNDSN